MNENKIRNQRKKNKTLENEANQYKNAGDSMEVLLRKINKKIESEKRDEEER